MNNSRIRRQGQETKKTSTGANEKIGGGWKTIPSRVSPSPASSHFAFSVQLAQEQQMP